MTRLQHKILIASAGFSWLTLGGDTIAVYRQVIEDSWQLPIAVVAGVTTISAIFARKIMLCEQLYLVGYEAGLRDGLAYDQPDNVVPLHTRS